jgi:hypothetical protein
MSRTIITLVLGAFILSAAPGCASLEESIARIESVAHDASIARDSSRSRLDELELLRESIPDSDPDAPALDSAISRLRAQIAVLDSAILHAHRTIENARHPDDALTIAIDSISPWIPAPIQAPLVLGAALFATLARSGALKQSAKSIVESIDHAMRTDPAMRSAIESNADSIRTIQTPQARRLVNKWTKPAG